VERLVALSARMATLVPSRHKEFLRVEFQMRASERWIVKVDNWRNNQSAPMSRAEAVRRLIDQALPDE
jgi:hypothetical protein